MFSRIRNRLTFLYTGLMILFLLTFMALSYFILSQFLYHDSKQEILHLAQQEKIEHTKDFVEWWEGKEKGEDYPSYSHRPFSRSFYLLVSHQGELIEANAPPILIESANIERILQWKPQEGEVRFDRLSLAENEQVHVVLAGNPVYHEGRFLGTVYTGADISQQTHVLDRLISILTGLSIVFVLLSALISYFMAGKAMNPIFHALRRQREFVADASHELRTPLTVIHSSLEVLAAEEKKGMSEFSQQLLDDLQEETERMGKLLYDLLTLARIDSGVMENSYQSFDLRPMLDSLMRSFHSLAIKKNLELSLEMDRDYTVYADPERLRQLFYILMDNALRYTPEHGNITIQVTQIPGKDPALKVAVTDTGIGISEDQQKRIFDRFYRSDSARSREHGGTGLGLSIAKWIVQSHRGTIDVESTIGKGTTFLLKLPILNKEVKENG